MHSLQLQIKQMVKAKTHRVDDIISALHCVTFICTLRQACAYQLKVNGKGRAGLAHHLHPFPADDVDFYPDFVRHFATLRSAVMKAEGSGFSFCFFAIPTQC